MDIVNSSLFRVSSKWFIVLYVLNDSFSGETPCTSIMK